MHNAGTVFLDLARGQQPMTDDILRLTVALGPNAGASLALVLDSRTSRDSLTLSGPVSVCPLAMRKARSVTLWLTRPTVVGNIVCRITDHARDVGTKTLPTRVAASSRPQSHGTDGALITPLPHPLPRTCILSAERIPPEENKQRTTFSRPARSSLSQRSAVHCVTLPRRTPSTPPRPSPATPQCPPPAPQTRPPHPPLLARRHQESSQGASSSSLMVHTRVRALPSRSHAGPFVCDVASLVCVCVLNVRA
jgi:hypothetical protein